MPSPIINPCHTATYSEACPLQPITIHLSVSADFKALCKYFEMNPTAVLQLFIDHFSVYAEMVEPQYTTHSSATGFFVNFKEQRKEKPIEKNEAKRAVDIHYMTLVAGTIGNSILHGKERTEIFNQLIDDWFEALYKLNQPLHNNENTNANYLNEG